MAYIYLRRIYIGTIYKRATLSCGQEVGIPEGKSHTELMTMGSMALPCRKDGVLLLEHREGQLLLLVREPSPPQSSPRRA